MILQYGDWRFLVDVEATKERTARYSYEHCQCGYCKNFYDAVDIAHPHLRPAMEQFGVHLEGPNLAVGAAEPFRKRCSHCSGSGGCGYISALGRRVVIAMATGGSGNGSGVSCQFAGISGTNAGSLASAA